MTPLYCTDDLQHAITEAKEKIDFFQCDLINTNNLIMENNFHISNNQLSPEELQEKLKENLSLEEARRDGEAAVSSSIAELKRLREQEAGFRNGPIVLGKRDNSGVDGHCVNVDNKRS